jgi:hypothetical protein
MKFLFYEDYEKRSDLKKYGDSSLLLYTLELYLGIDDIHSVAVNSLTDNNDDKKCDLLHVDKEAHIAIIAQGYISKDTTRKEAKSNKAADLNTAASWLLKQNTADLPKTLQSAGNELVNSIINEEINAIEFWYVHNLPESKNVDKELVKVTETAHALIKKNFPNITIERITYKEFGVNRIEELYKSTKIPIKIDKNILIKTDKGFSISSDKYTAFITYLTGEWIKQQFDEFGRDLFSANIRDYLGSRESKENINNQIKVTAKESSDDFFVFNNGITIIVNDLDLSKFEISNEILVSGLAIVNGAQTTGSISSSESSKLKNLKVLTRFVKYNDKTIIEDIIKYNNTQNYIAASDFRSNDDTQKRLREEFSKINYYEYTGARRGSAEDMIRRPPNLIPTDTAAQALACFHQEPNIAYNEKKNIWINDKIYSRYFFENTTAVHIIYVVSLFKSVENLKSVLKLKNENEKTKEENELLDILRKKGSTFIYTAAIASCMEIFTSSPIKDTFTLQFKSVERIPSYIDHWKPIIDATAPFITELNDSLDNNLKNSQIIKENISSFFKMVSATKNANYKIYKDFHNKITF